MSMFLLLFATELWVKLKPVTYTWREGMIFDMTTIFDLGIFKYTALLIALSLKKKKKSWTPEFTISYESLKYQIFEFT